MNKLIYTLLTTLFISTSIFAQEKIGNKIYLYGDLENSVNGKTLIHYDIDDPKVEYKIISRFKKKGVNAVSWNKLFIPGYKYSDSDRKTEIRKKNIETIILIKLNNKTTYEYWNSETSYYKSTDSFKTKETSGNAISNIGLIFEIYTEKDRFEKPIAVINGNAKNLFGESESRVSLKVITKVLNAMMKEKAFEQ